MSLKSVQAGSLSNNNELEFEKALSNSIDKNLTRSVVELNSKLNADSIVDDSTSVDNSVSESQLFSSPTPLSTRESSPLPPLSSRENAEFSDESDDEVQDWSLLNNFSKTGMKDLEPLLTDADYHQLSAYDQHKLNKARNMRFSALSVKRGSIVNLENLKASTIYVNLHDHNDLFMLQPKGKFLETMGMIDNQNICHFGFEEVLYLVERGSCMLKFWDKTSDKNNEIYESMPPLSLQAAYSILIKNEEQLNQYLVFSILKRDGYIITRNEEFSGEISEKKNDLFKSSDNLFKNIKMSLWTRVLMKVSEFFKIQFPFGLAFSYYNIFTYLHSKILNQSIPQLPALTNVNQGSRFNKNYKISFNVWKPSPNFKKKNPPPPDYQISVFKATQKFPKYSEIKSILERSYSNPDTYKPKPKMKNKNKNTDSKIKENENEKKNEVSAKVLESSWNYAKGIDMNNLKYSQHRITFAIVDNTTVNFITLSHCSFVGEGPVWRDHWVTWRPPQKKKRQHISKSHKTHKNTLNLTVKTSDCETFEERNNSNQKDKPPASAHF
jgi:tRNA-splicing endonuclease subunit Sen54